MRRGPDTKEIAAETEGLVEKLKASRDGVFWIQEMMPAEKVREVYSLADVFVCPSIYEPLGIVNLEAMACETAVVASRVGGIPEVVVDGETGVLVDYDANDTAGFEAALAEAVNAVAGDAERAAAMWPNKGEADPRPPQSEGYRRIDPVQPNNPMVPDDAPAALRLPLRVL